MAAPSAFNAELRIIAMNGDLRRRYIRDLLSDLQQAGGARLEMWIRHLWDAIAGDSVSARGLNAEGAPVGGIVDAVWPDRSISEASSEATYFDKPYKKPKSDFKHAVKTPGVRVVRLFSTREAGPTAMNYADRVSRLLARRGFTLDVWDGRRIAEYIVDRLLTDERFVRLVGDALPNLRRISEQNAASSLVPKPDPLYQGRDEEEARLLRLLERSKCVVVYGFGGIGKSELVCAVAHRIRDEYELVIWTDGDRFKRLADFSSFEVRLNGYALNILGLLRSHKTLLIMDNVRVNVSTEALAESCGESSRVIVTSQVAFGVADMTVGFLSREHARNILSAGSLSPCPDAALGAVLQAVEGHPLVLRMLNQQAKAANYDWSEVERYCRHIAGSSDETRRTVADRILEQHIKTIGPELKLFAWCESASLDRGLFEHIFGPNGVDELEQRALTALNQSDAIRLHALVYASLQRLLVQHHLPIDGDRFKSELERYLISQLRPKGLGFYRVVNRHRDLILRLLKADSRPGALRYAYLHNTPLAALQAELLGDPAADSADGPRGDTQAWTLSIIEVIEADYLRERAVDKTAASQKLASRLSIFDTLAEDRRLTEDDRRNLRHHRAKALFRIGRAPESLAAFEAIVADGGTHYASKLQIARLSEKNTSRAGELIFEIIEAEYVSPGSVATGVLLDTLSTLRRQHLRKFVPEMTRRYGTFMAQQIKAAACSGEHHPIHAFSAIGSDWSYKEPKLFWEIFEEIDFREPQDAEDDDERVAIGRILTAAGKTLLRRGEPEAASARFAQACDFFSHVKRRSAFSRVHYADALLRANQAESAADLLESVPLGEREKFWFLRRGEAHLFRQELAEALQCVDSAFDNFALGDFQSTFLALKSDILHELKHCDSAIVLQQAITACGEPQHRQDLESKLAQRNPS